LGRVLGAAVATSLVAALVAPTVGTAANRTIRSRAGLVTSVGPLKPTDAGVSRLTTLFGRPTAIVPQPNSCTVRFSQARITVVLANFLGGSACQSGPVQSAVVNGRAWHTQRGLRVGDRIARLKSLYPQARFRDGAWQLETAPLLGLTVATLRASVAGGRVSRIRASLSGRRVTRSFRAR
jgi:hypothetical protein